MKRVCCKCEKVLDKGTGEENERISHGFCAECFKEEMKSVCNWDNRCEAMYQKAKKEELENSK